MVKGIGDKKDTKDKDTKKEERLKDKEKKKAEKEKQRAEKQGTTRGKALTVKGVEEAKNDKTDDGSPLSPKPQQPFVIAAPPANPFPPNIAAQLSTSTSSSISNSSSTEAVGSPAPPSPSPSASISLSPTPSASLASPSASSPIAHVAEVAPKTTTAPTTTTDTKAQATTTHTAPAPAPAAAPVTPIKNVSKVAEKPATAPAPVRSDADKANLLKAKLSALPEENKVVVEYLLNIFGKVVPQQWQAPATLDLPSAEEQVEVTLDKLLEASEILFNKDHHAMLKRYTKEMNESPKRRVEKWKLLCSILTQNESFLDLFNSSNTLEAAVKSAVSQPLEDHEAEILLDLIHQPLMIESAHKDLLAIIKTSSHSNPFIKASVDGVKSLTDAVVELVASFKKRKEDDLSQIQHPPPETPRDHTTDKKEAVDFALGTSLAISLLGHANVISHAKAGNDLSIPLGNFFEEQIKQEEKKGEELKETSTKHRHETEKRLEQIDGEIKQEQTKLAGVQAEIKDLEFKLVQKRAEEKALEELLAHQQEQHKKYKEEQEKALLEITNNIAENKTQHGHHVKSLECVQKFAVDISDLLDKEVDETIKKTRDILVELDKEMTFLEEKMASYERSFSLFSAADEPEVLDGLKKLFVRSAAIYVESKQSVSRVKSVVTMLHTVLSNTDRNNEKEAVKEVEGTLEKIVQRQTSLNQKYKLQK
jgi:hypothetical protein